MTDPRTQMVEARFAVIDAELIDNARRADALRKAGATAVVAVEATAPSAAVVPTEVQL